MASIGRDSPGEGRRQGFFANVGGLVLARAYSAAAQVLVLPILARHLAVEDFAVMALAMTVVIFTTILSDAGLGRSLIRSKGYDPAEWSTVFWMLVGVGVLLAAVVLVVAPVWAWFFEQPALWPILSVLALVPLFQALSAAPNAEVERREHYTALARLQVIAATAGFITAVYLALANAGVWALVAQQLAFVGLRLVGVAWLTEFRPALTFSRSLIGGHLRFARDALTESMIQTARAQSAVVVIGKTLGEGPLGIFAMSQRFTRLPQFGLAGPMSSVVYVRMAKVQDNTASVVQIYLAASRLLAAALFVPLALVSIGGPAIFTLFLSPEWAPVAPVFALSIPGLALEAATVTMLACLFRATGRTDLLVRLTLEGAILSIALVVVAAVFLGLEAVAASITVWSLIYIPRAWIIAQRVVPLRIWPCIEALVRPVCTAIAFVLIYIAITRTLGLPYVGEALVAIGLALTGTAVNGFLDRVRLSNSAATLRDTGQSKESGT